MAKSRPIFDGKCAPQSYPSHQRRAAAQDDGSAAHMAGQILDYLNYVGVMGVEFFPDGGWPFNRQ